MAALENTNLKLTLLIVEVLITSDRLKSFKKLQNVGRWIHCHYCRKMFDFTVKTKKNTE